MSSSPSSLPIFLTTVLEVLVQAGVRFPFTAWHRVRLDGWLRHVDRFKQDLKIRSVLVLDWTRVLRSFYAYLRKDKTLAKFSSPDLLGGSFMGVISRRCQRCTFLMRIVPPF